VVVRLWRRWKSIDWRIKAIVIPVVLASAASGLIWYLGHGRNPTTFFGAVFAAWIGGLALYAVIGSVVAYVSLPRPERESFDARARILFRHQSGKHIDYIITRFKTLLEHYTERTVIKVILIDYDPPSKKVRISCETKTTVRAYIDDIVSTFSSEIKLTEIADAPSGKEGNRIVFLRLNNVPQTDCRCDFVGSVHRPYHVAIEPKSVCEIERCSQVWTVVDTEDNTHTPVRYTQELILDFENRLPSGTAVVIRLSRDAGQNWEDIELRSGESKTACSCKDASPGTEIYRYRVKPI
jgi:hypothetical protein